MEAASGFEPLSGGFADLSLNHLGTPPCFGERPILAGRECVFHRRDVNSIRSPLLRRQARRSVDERLVHREVAVRADERVELVP